jgi:hypothetical protein
MIRTALRIIDVSNWQRCCLGLRNRSARRATARHNERQGRDGGERPHLAAGRGREVIEYRFHRSLPLPREGYPGVVEAEAALARELAGSIASAVQELHAP